MARRKLRMVVDEAAIPTMERLLSSKAAAEALGISRMTLHRMVQRGDLVAVRISPNRIGFRQSDLKQLMGVE